MLTSDWLILAGIVLTVVSAFGLPGAIWVTKMWSSQKVTNVRLRTLSGRMRRLENSRPAGMSVLTEAVNSAKGSIDTLSDRVNEHAEHLADQGARLANTEGEIKDLRLKQHTLSNVIATLQNSK